MLQASNPKIETNKIIQNMENKINETLEKKEGYADMVLEMQPGTLNPKFKRFVLLVTIKFSIKA